MSLSSTALDSPLTGEPEANKVFPTKRLAFWCYSLGAVTFATVDGGLSGLLMVYATHVWEVTGFAMSIIMMITICTDAFVDLAIGHFSDRTNSRFGRRHPWMYTSILVLPFAYYALWSPLWDPRELSDWQKYGYIFGLNVFVRSSMSFFEVPSTAQLPEFETDYDLRNLWLAGRYLIANYAGLIMTTAALSLWIGHHGLSSPLGYAKYGEVSGVILLIVLPVAALGTQREFLNKPRPPRMEWSMMCTEVKASLAATQNKHFRAMFNFSFCTSLILGLTTTLGLFVSTYYYEMSTDQIATITASGALNPLLGNGLAVWLGAKWGKKRTAMTVIVVLILICNIPMVMVQLGWWDGGSTRDMWVLIIHNAAMACCFMIVGIMVDSMVADTVEDAEVETSRRTEGLFFAARGFAGKLVSGVGIVLAGIILSALGLDKISSVDQMTDKLRLDLFLTMVPTSTFLLVVALYFFSRYNIDKEQHIKNLKTLSIRSMQSRKSMQSKSVQEMPGESQQQQHQQQQQQQPFKRGAGTKDTFDVEV